MRSLRLLLSLPALGLLSLLLTDATPAAAAPTPVVSASGFGALNGALDSGAVLSAPIDNAQTSLTVSDHYPFKVGMKIKIDNEQMQILGIQTDLLTLVNTLTVSRGASPVGHALSAPIWANWIPMEIQVSLIPVTRDAGTLTALLSSATTQVSGAKLFSALGGSTSQGGTSTGVTHLTMTNSTATWPSNFFSGYTVTSGGRTLLVTSNTATVLTGFGGWQGGPDPAPGAYTLVGAPSVVRVSDATLISPGSTITVDGEQMNVANVFDSGGDGYAGDIEAQLGSNAADLRIVPESTIPGLNNCGDGVDNDSDGQVDLADAGCATTDTDGDGFSNALETALFSSTTIALTPESAAVPSSCTDAVVGTSTAITHTTLTASTPGGTSTGVTATTMTNSTATWTPNSLIGYTATSGSRTLAVSSNTATVLTGSAGWQGGAPPPPGAYTMAWTPSALVGQTATAGQRTLVVTANTGTVLTGAAGWQGGGDPVPGAFTLPLNNDGDAAANGADVGCDSLDADVDGFIGAAEIKFPPASPSNKNSTPETGLYPFTCADTVDNDGDGQVDLADAGCATADADTDTFSTAVETALGSNPNDATRTPEHAALLSSCEDGLDNDGDTLKDAEDSGCSGADVDPDELQVGRGANGSPLQSHLANATIIENVINMSVSDQSLITTGSTLQIDSEQVLVKFVEEGTPDLAGVTRGANSTSVVVHSNGAAIADLDGLGSFTQEIQFNASLGEFVSGVDSTLLSSTGREGICNDQFGPFVDSGATLSADLNNVDTTFAINDQRLIRLGAMIRIESEQMFVTGIVEGTPDIVTVIRAQGGTAIAAHSAGWAVFGQNTGGGAARYSCVTSEPAPFGPTGSGKLALIKLVPLSLQNASSPVTTPSSTLLDITGDPYPHVTQNGALRIIRCADPTGNGVSDFFDFIEIAKATFGLIPPVLALHDVNADGAVDFFDFTDTAKLVFLSPSELKCLQ